MIDRVESRFAMRPTRLIGDMAYGAAELLGWMVEDKSIQPHVPVLDKTQRTDETLSSNDFQWDEQSAECRCPQGHALRSEWRCIQDSAHSCHEGRHRHLSIQSIRLRNCPIKARCCPNTSIRKIARSVHERARDIARSIAGTPAYQQSRKDRKKVEMLFAHLERITKLDRLRLPGITGARDELLLAATAQNLRRMAKLCLRARIPGFRLQTTGNCVGLA